LFCKEKMAATNGRADPLFIADVRRILRDQPVVFGESQPTDGVTGALTAGSKPFRLQRAPVIKTGGLTLTAPGGNYAVNGLNSYQPAFDQPIWPGTLAPVVADGGAGGTLPAGDYQIFWTLGTGVNAAPPGSLASPLSNKLVGQAVNHLITITGLPNPIPVGGINIYIIWQSTGTPPPLAWGFALFIAAGAAGPYQISAPGSGLLPVFINSDTGEILFGNAPTTGTLAVTYQAVRFSDVQVSASLYEGLQLLWPDVWNPNVDTTSILVSPTQYEYTLPATFQDQRVVLLSVEFAPPSGIVRYYKTSLWHLVTDVVNPLLVFSRLPPVASTVRLTYTKPIGNGALGDTPTIAQHLPTYYALARLLLDQDTMRSRSDDLSALTGEAAQQPGAAINTANYWLQQFSTQLTRMSMSEPARTSIRDRAVERLGLSDFWTNLA
jgi:hypothetical protein